MDKSSEKEKRDRQKSDRIKSPQQNSKEKEPTSHDKYNTRYEVSSILNEIFKKIWCEPSKQEIQQGSLIHIFWLNRWDGTIQSLATQSKRPHHHPNEHTPEEIALIRRFRKRNPQLEVTELWHRLKKKGYTRRVESLYRVMRRLGMLPEKKEKTKPVSKPYEQMTHPGERVQVDVKVVPRCCLADPTMKLYQYTAIDEFTRLRFLYGYEEQSTYSSADFARRLVEWYKRRGIKVECIQTDNGFEFTNRFSSSKKNRQTLLRRH